MTRILPGIREGGLRVVLGGCDDLSRLSLFNEEQQKGVEARGIAMIMKESNEQIGIMVATVTSLYLTCSEFRLELHLLVKSRTFFYRQCQVNYLE